MNTKLVNSPLYHFYTGTGYHVFYCTAVNHYLYGCGRNQHGQLGLVNSGKKVLTPVRIGFFMPVEGRKIKKISLGRNFTMYLCEDLSLYTSGHNGKGQCSIAIEEDVQRVMHPLPVISSSPNQKFKNVFTGVSTTYLLSLDGEVFSCGENTKGNLGLGHTREVRNATKIPKLRSVIEVTPGGNTNNEFVLFRLNSGRIYGCGNNIGGILGRQSDTVEAVYTPVELQYFKKNSIRISSIVVAIETAYFITNKRNVYCLGSNSKGQFGNGEWGSEHHVPVLSKRLSQYSLFCRGGGEDFVAFYKQRKYLGTGSSDITWGWSNFGFCEGSDGENLEVVTKPTETSLFRGKKVEQINTAFHNTYVICNSGREVYAVGCGGDGRMMNGTTLHLKKFKLVLKFGENDGLEKIKGARFVQDEKMERIEFLVEKNSTCFIGSTAMYLLL